MGSTDVVVSAAMFIALNISSITDSHVNTTTDNVVIELSTALS